MFELAIGGFEIVRDGFTRAVDRKRSLLEQRQERAQVLTDSTLEWSKCLVMCFDAAAVKWLSLDPARAAYEIVKQQENFTALDYTSLEISSPVYKFLGEDARFVPFINACKDFYESALEIKSVAYGSIKAQDGTLIYAHENTIEQMVKAWKDSVQGRLRNVQRQNSVVQCLPR